MKAIRYRQTINGQSITFKWNVHSRWIDENNQIRHIESYRSNMKRMIFDTPYHWITLHPKCHLIRKPYLTNCHIFSFFQVIKLSALDFQRCESSVIMITQTCYNESCAKHLWKENVYSQQHDLPISQNETVRYLCPKGESYAAILCVRLTYPWRRTRLCINTLLNWIYSQYISSCLKLS
jgi:hypothetical protein